jgi:Domain of unknown function (DUF4157)
MGWMRTHLMERGPAKKQARKKPQALPPLKRKPSVPLTAAEIAHVQRWLATGRAQASLKVSQPQDAQEIEADETAERVMRAPESAELSADGEHAQRSPLPAGSKPDAAETAAQLPSLRTEGGSSLPQSELEFMNERFRRNFGGVRIHTGPAAAALAESVQAKAFTVGNDIVFGENQFQPGTTAGRKLLAHELTHTVQQGQRNGQHNTAIMRQAAPLPIRMTSCIAESSTAIFVGWSQELSQRNGNKTLEMRTFSGGAWTRVKDFLYDTTYTVTGLQSGTTYLFRIKYNGVAGNEVQCTTRP